MGFAKAKKRTTKTAIINSAAILVTIDNALVRLSCSGNGATSKLSLICTGRSSYHVRMIAFQFLSSELEPHSHTRQAKHSLSTWCL